jgi:DNA 3'-phosphatase
MATWAVPEPGASADLGRTDLTGPGGEDKKVSRRQLRVTSHADGTWALERLGPHASFVAQDGHAASLLEQHAVRRVQIPTTVWLGRDVNHQPVHPVQLIKRSESAASSTLAAAPVSDPPPAAADDLVDLCDSEEDCAPAPAPAPAVAVPAPAAPDWRAKRPAAAAPAGSSSKAARTLAPGLSSRVRDAALPDGWGCFGGSLLVWEHRAPLPAAAIAAFDFDGCLAKTALGGFDPDAWEMMFDHVPAVLRALHAQGHKLVVVTNESLDRFVKLEAVQKALRKKIGRLEGFARAADVPLQVLVATSKKDDFRKPGAGAWRYVCANNGGEPPELARCFFVGDAAGRPGDIGDSDRMFAEKVGIRFFTEKQFFGQLHPG